MIEGSIAIRYARALIELAKQDNQIDVFAAQLKGFLDYCTESKYLLSTLSEKGYDVGSRLRIIENIAQKSGFHTHVKNFLKLLLGKGRVALISLIYDEYCQMANEIMDRCPMTVLSAVELPVEQYQEMMDFFGKKNKKNMILNKKISPDVLGGVCVTIGDQIYDYTLSRQLSDLKQGMI